MTNVGGGGCVVERRTVNRGDGGSIPSTAVSKLRQFRSPHICLCLSEETLKAWWSLLSGVYARGSKRSHTGVKCITCSGLTNACWNLNVLQRPPSSILEQRRNVVKINTAINTSRTIQLVLDKYLHGIHRRRVHSQ